MARAPSSVEVPGRAAGSRADRFVADASGLSRAYVQRLIAEGRVTARRRAGARRDAVLRRAPRWSSTCPTGRRRRSSRRTIPLDVVYEDDDVLIVDKPAGLVTHPSPGHDAGTLVNALLGSTRGRRRPGHGRPAWSGRASSIGSTATRAACSWSPAPTPPRPRSRRSSRRAASTRRYLALVGGVGRRPQVGPHRGAHRPRPAPPQRMAVVPDGPAGGDRLPGARAVRAAGRCSSSTCITGRTHQIRVHLASIGHPVAGDPVYATGAARRGPDGLERLFLHAWRLEFASPVGRAAHPRRGAAARRSSSRCWTACGRRSASADR